MGHILLMLSAMLLAALLLQPLAERLRLPFAAVLVATGFIGSELIVWAGMDTGLRHDTFAELIFFVFLPLLIFEAAFRIDARLLRRNLGVVLFLAVPVMLLSTALVAALVYWGIAHPTGFPWIAALLTGALLSATDPAAVIDLMRRLRVPERLVILMDGESLFNDAVAIVTFGIFLYLALHPQEQVTLADASLRFVVVFLGGLLVGLVMGLAFLLLSRLFEEPLQQGVITLISAYTSYLAAEEALQVSGVMAVLVVGLIMGRVIHQDYPDPDQPDGFVDRFWGFNAYVASALVFLLMGVTITVEMFTERWLAMLIGIAAVLVARAAGIFGTAPLLNRLPWVEPIAPGDQGVLFLGGLRGAVTLALALSLPVTLDYWWTIQSIAFGVVVFTLFVQAPLLPLLIRRAGLR